MPDLPPVDHIINLPQTAYCVVSAAQRFSLPIEGLLGILLVENGKVGQAVPNPNGSRDLGPMQINTIWLGQQSPLFGYVTEQALRYDLCTNIHSAAWIIASELRKGADIWSAVGRYHAPNNPQAAWKYKLKVNSMLPQVRYIMYTVPAYRQNIEALLAPSK